MDIESQVVEIPVQPVIKARITIVGHLYFQEPGGSPTLLDHAYQVNVDSDEQPFTRKFKVGQEWRKLDLGWNEDPSMIEISNEVPFLSQQPTEEERKEIKSRVLEMGVATDDDILLQWLIPVGDWLRFVPYAAGNLRIRCRCGEAIVILTVFPK